jgi:hypothetical protein
VANIDGPLKRMKPSGLPLTRSLPNGQAEKKIGHRLQKAGNLTEAEAKAISDNVQELSARSWKWLLARYNGSRFDRGQKRKVVNISDEDDDIGQPGPGPSTQRRLRKAKKVDYGFQSSDEGESFDCTVRYARRC